MVAPILQRLSSESASSATMSPPICSLRSTAGSRVCFPKQNPPLPPAQSNAPPANSKPPSLPSAPHHRKMIRRSPRNCCSPSAIANDHSQQPKSGREKVTSNPFLRFPRTGSSPPIPEPPNSASPHRLLHSSFGQNTNTFPSADTWNPPKSVPELPHGQPGILKIKSMSSRTALPLPLCSSKSCAADCFWLTLLIHTPNLPK